MSRPVGLVELYGLPERILGKDLLEPSPSQDPEVAEELLAREWSPNGWQGQVIEYRNDTATYVVETFTGLRVRVEARNVKELIPSPPEQGGFHVAWPPEGNVEALADFSASAACTLMREGYCVIQLSLSEDVASGASVEVQCGRYRWKRLRREFEAAYLGRHQKSKTAWLEEMVEEKNEIETPVDTLDLYLARFTQLMIPMAPYALDFVPHSRTSAMLRTPASAADAGQAEMVNEEDIAKGLVDSHIDYLKRRKLCMLLVADGSGGELTLFPKDGDPIVLTVEPGRLVVFRHDRISYAYRPQSDEDLVLQAWVLTPKQELTLGKVEGDIKLRDELFGLVSGPNTPDGRQICVYGIGLQLPGGSHDHHENYWACVAAGTDAYIKAPLSRFDIDLYTKTDDDWRPGYTYTVHAGFVEDIYSFDNEFFGVSEDEASILAPSNRQLLERGYEALYKSGYQKKKARGQRIGVYVGHSGDDWTSPIFTCGGEDKHRYGYASRKWSAIAGRLCHTLGLTGPQSLVDTACSSALVAYGVGHTAMRQQPQGRAPCGSDSCLLEALMMGANLIPGPGNFINLSGPHMLSIHGRCFTFDTSADGFERGEGDSAFYVRSEEVVTREAFATVIGACLNQDGRSASMTAPNGPAQQECIRGSMREAGLTANQITCSELHGTGTALGDPIEVGALRGVMDQRKVPIMQTSAKSHIGHLEANAGQAGIIKCMLMCNACAGTPNCHLISLNPHLDTNGYPTIFNTELTEYGNQSGYSGVSSFGFGGANARADVFAIAHRGSRKSAGVNLEKVDYIQVACPFDEGPMHYLDGRAIPTFAARQAHRGKYHCDNIRDEFDSYECNTGLYDGKYQMQPQEEEALDPPDASISVIGSWDAFKEATKMTASADGDSWTCLVRLGETRCERLQLRIEGDESAAIFPVVRNGSMITRVASGSVNDGKGKFWLIDGRDDEAPAGSLYRVTFSWGLRPSLRWERLDTSLSDDALVDSKVLGDKAKHRYYVVASWSSWNCIAMHDVSDSQNQNVFEATLRIGMSRSESFRFVRDQDMEQVIYPARPTTDAEAADVPVRGPDDLCNGKSWRVTGKFGEQLRIRLQVVDASVTVSVTGITKPQASWTSSSVTGPARHSYWVSGSFNDWTPQQMLPGDRTGTFCCRGVVGPRTEERFVVLVDEDPGLMLYPDAVGSVPVGLAIVRGPGPADDDRDFSLACLKEGAEFEIVLDLQSPDKRKVVDVRWLSERVDEASMRETFLRFFDAR